MGLLSDIDYPEDDGNPMSDNTRQYWWIVTIATNLQRMYLGRDDVFVAGNLFWCPVEGNKYERAAPDTMVAFGRPPGRRSYLQWEEDGVAPQIVFEVPSPQNRRPEMDHKRQFSTSATASRSTTSTTPTGC